MSHSIKRRLSRAARIRHISVGGISPVVVQSMTNIDTVDYVLTVIQCAELARSGSELVRVTGNTPETAAGVPLIGDFHYNGYRLLLDNPACAEDLAKYRINPGNQGFEYHCLQNRRETVKMRRRRSKSLYVKHYPKDYCPRSRALAVNVHSWGERNVVANHPCV